jgi:hypothetical protein
MRKYAKFEKITTARFHVVLARSRSFSLTLTLKATVSCCLCIAWRNRGSMYNRALRCGVTTPVLFAKNASWGRFVTLMMSPGRPVFSAMRLEDASVTIAMRVTTLDLFAMNAPGGRPFTFMTTPHHLRNASGKTLCHLHESS